MDVTNYTLTPDQCAHVVAGGRFCVACKHTYDAHMIENKICWFCRRRMAWRKVKIKEAGRMKRAKIDHIVENNPHFNKPY